MPSEKPDQSGIWNQFINDTYPIVRQLPDPVSPAETDRYAVAIEPREHPHLEYVLRNIMHFLGPEWGLQLFLGRRNREYVEKLVRGWGDVQIAVLDRDNLTDVEYNQLKKYHSFWQTVKGDTVLWFECDCLLRRRGIDRYLDFDYVGAPWKPELSISAKIPVGNGGLSVRKRAAMLEASSDANPNAGLIYPEDVFFCINMALRPERFRIADPETARSFAVESIDHPDPFGIHKIWKYQPKERVIELLDGIRYDC